MSGGERAQNSPIDLSEGAHLISSQTKVDDVDDYSREMSAHSLRNAMGASLSTARYKRRARAALAEEFPVI